MENARLLGLNVPMIWCLLMLTFVCVFVPCQVNYVPQMPTGVYSGTGCYSDTMYILNLGSLTWSNVTAQANAPSIRAYHTMTFDERTGVLVVVGGYYKNADNFRFWYNDVHVFSTATLSWLPTVQFGIPMPISYFHSALVVGASTYIFGGCTNQDFYNSLYVTNRAILAKKNEDK